MLDTFSVFIPASVSAAWTLFNSSLKQDPTVLLPCVFTFMYADLAKPKTPIYSNIEDSIFVFDFSLIRRYLLLSRFAGFSFSCLFFIKFRGFFFFYFFLFSFYFFLSVFFFLFFRFL